MITADNQTDKIRRRIRLELLNLFNAGRLDAEIDLLPNRLYPKDNKNIRCCVYKDRAITRFRIMALLGFDVAQDDELTQLSEYRQMALRRETPDDFPLTMISDACRSCSSGKHIVTDLCQGCVAQYCRMNCPKDAILMDGGHARIISEKCVNCGKCRQVCPYNAVGYLPIPCEEACPVGAIRKDEYGVAHIDEENCISCGKCMRACPFGAVEVKSELFDVAEKLKSKSTHMTALVAPSVAGQFPGSVRQTVKALRMLGFDSVLEVAAGAVLTANEEAVELEHCVKENKLLATSCCPAWVRTAKTHVPEIQEAVSKTPTPAEFAAAMAKGMNPETVTVFLGPCIAKKTEARQSGMIDLVITFDELASMFISSGIDVMECTESDPDNSRCGSDGKMFAESGGVSKAVLKHTGGTCGQVSLQTIDGLNRKSISLLKQIAKGKIRADMVEVMACEGGCICGPAAVANPRISVKKLHEYMEEGEKATAAAAAL